MPLYTPNPKLNPKPKDNFGFHKSLSSILSDVEKFTEFNGTIIFQISAKGIAQKLWRPAAVSIDVSSSSIQTQSPVCLVKVMMIMTKTTTTVWMSDERQVNEASFSLPSASSHIFFSICRLIIGLVHQKCLSCSVADDASNMVNIAAG